MSGGDDRDDIGEVGDSYPAVEIQINALNCGRQEGVKPGVDRWGILHVDAEGSELWEYWHLPQQQQDAQRFNRVVLPRGDVEDLERSDMRGVT